MRKRTLAGRERVNRIVACAIDSFGAMTPRSVVSYRNARSIVDTRPRSSVAVTLQCHVPSTSNVEYVNGYEPGSCCTAVSSGRGTLSGPISCAVTFDGRTILYESDCVPLPGSPLTSASGGGAAYTPKYWISNASLTSCSPLGSLGLLSSWPSNAIVTESPEPTAEPVTAPRRTSVCASSKLVSPTL